MPLNLLVNGKLEPTTLVVVTFKSLQNLLQTNPIAFYELTMKARDSNHKIFSTQSIKPAIKLSLINEDYTFKPSVRNIILGSVKGDLLDMRLKFPRE